MFFIKHDITEGKKTAGMLVTESQSGDAPKPKCSMKINTKSKKNGNQGQVNHRNWSLFLSLLLYLEFISYLFIVNASRVH